MVPSCHRERGGFSSTAGSQAPGRLFGRRFTYSLCKPAPRKRSALPRVSKVTSRPRGQSYPPTSPNSPSEPELPVSYKPKICSLEPKLYKYIIKKPHRCKHVLREEEKLQ